MRDRQPIDNDKRKIVIDMVFFQINRSGIARVWDTLLRLWSQTEFGDQLIILDRVNSAPRIDGLNYVDIPAYSYSKMDSDCTMLQAVCDQYNAAIFLSTYYTRPHTTPSIMMVYDMIPEVLGWDLIQPMWQGKYSAIKAASHYICISATSAKDLRTYHPTTEQNITIARCGVDSHFHVASANELRSFKKKYGLSKPYFLLVGERSAHKNSFLFFSAIAQQENPSQFEVVCLGGRAELEPELFNLASHTKVTMLRVSDEEMRSAYSGALALVYPSLYEGFGMPVIEAMACGCPVITCPSGSIPEIAGNDVLYVGTNDVQAMINAMLSVQQPSIREPLVCAGLLRSQKYTWPQMATIVQTTIQELSKTQVEKNFNNESDIEVLQAVESAIKIVNDNRYDTPSLAKITDARLTCAQSLMGSNAIPFSDRLQGSLGESLRLLIKSGISQLAPTQADLPLMNQVITSLRFSVSDQMNLQSLAAAMLFAGPHTLLPRQALKSVQGGLQEIYRQYLLTPPASFSRAGEADQYAHFLTELMQEIVAGIATAPDDPYWNVIALDFVNTSTMIPLYFANSPLKQAMTLRAKIIEHLISRQFDSAGLNFTFSNREPGRIRIGILAAHYRPQTETYATLPVYSHLDPKKFEVILISQLPLGDHPLEQHCISFSETSLCLSGRLSADVRSIRELDLDALWIGTNLTAVMNYMVQLSVHRLARVQITGGCSPTTTGFANIDIFVSGTATEPEDASTHYTEQLHLVDGPAHCFDMANSLVQTADASQAIARESLGISQDTVLFVSGANFFKIIPELMSSWIEILKQTADSKILLFPFNPNWTSNYPVANFLLEITRQANAAGVESDRFVIVPPLPDRSAVLELIRLADIYLDSFPYSGMTSLLDPLEVCMPIIAIEGFCQRQRMSASALKSLKLHDWLVPSQSAYVQRAVELASNPAKRLEMQEELVVAQQTKPLFLNSKWFSDSIETLLEEHVDTMKVCKYEMNPKFSKFLNALSESTIHEAYTFISQDFDNEGDIKIANALRGICTSHFMRQRSTKLNALFNLKKDGFDPSLVIDVGAQVGTPELYTVYPEARHIFIEPVAEYIPILNDIARQLKSATVMQCAISNINGTTTLSVTDTKQYSSIDGRIGEESREVEVRTVDSLLEHSQLEGSILLKIDVDGPELKVLQGSKNLLINHDCVIVIEACLACAPARFSSLTEYMSRYGYEVFDILDSLYRPSDWHLWQVDLIFVKSDSKLRENNSYS